MISDRHTLVSAAWLLARLSARLRTFQARTKGSEI